MGEDRGLDVPSVRTMDIESQNTAGLPSQILYRICTDLALFQVNVKVKDDVPLLTVCVNVPPADSEGVDHLSESVLQCQSEDAFKTALQSLSGDPLIGHLSPRPVKSTVQEQPLQGTA